MWKIAQPRPSTKPKTVPTRPVAAHSHSSRNMISPAYMLPNSRSECDSGLDMYSTRLNRKLAGHSSGLEPNGAQNSSWIQPPTPLTLMAKQIISSHTDSASAKVVLTSAVGTMRKPCSEMLVRAQRDDVHRQEVHRVHQQHPDEHRQRGGRDEACCGRRGGRCPSPGRRRSRPAARRTPGACSGTPAVAPRTTHQMKPMPTHAEQRSDVTSESTLIVQKPPSPNRLASKKRQVVLDVLGRS